jgi:hypothetical protein
LTAVIGFGLLLTRFTWYMRCVGGDSSVAPFEIVRSSAATGVGGRHSGAEAGIALIAQAGLRETGELIGLQPRSSPMTRSNFCCISSTSDCSKSAPVRASPSRRLLCSGARLFANRAGNARRPAHGDIESAISTYEQLRFYNPKLGLTVKPYVVATGAILADAPYMGGIGGGLTLHATAGNVSLDPYGEVVQQSFRNSSFYPLATGLSGTLSTVGLQASGPIASGLAWQSRIAFARANDQSAFDSYKSFAGDIWLPWLNLLGGNAAVDDHSDGRRDDLAIRCARPVRRAFHHRPHHRMARRTRCRSADLAPIGVGRAAAISKRHL